jgi:hypothetical protein
MLKHESKQLLRFLQLGFGLEHLDCVGHVVDKRLLLNQPVYGNGLISNVWT